MKRLDILLLAVCGLALLEPSLAQSDESPTITWAPPPYPAETCLVTWPTVAGRHYYLQVSPTLELPSWTYAPVSVTGNGANLVQPISVTASPPGRFFLRVQWFADANRAPNADYDGDGLTNAAEVTQHGTMPFKADSDGDGLNDGAEIGNGTDPLVPDMPEISLQYRWRHGHAWREGNINKRVGSNSTPKFAQPISYSGFANFNAISESAAAMASFEGMNLVSWTSAELDTPITAHVHACLAPTGYEAPGPVAIPYGSATADCREFEFRIVSSRAVEFPISRTFVQAQRKRLGSADWIDEVSSTPLVSLTIQPNATTSPGYIRSVPEWTGLPSDSTTFRREATIKAASIEPETDSMGRPTMAGVVGDIVPSVNPISNTLHFVSPKKSPELDKDFIVLQAKGLTATDFGANGKYQWEGGVAHPSDARKRQVSRSTTGRHLVKITTKGNNQIAAQMYVWIVWSTVSATPGNGQWVDSGGGAHEYRFPLALNGDLSGWRFKFKIDPQEILNDKERPALSGASRKPAPGASKTYTIDPTLKADSAILKWDVSRKMKIFIRNPGLIPKALLKAPPVTATIFDNQPLAEDTPVSFPAEDAEGNDDPALAQEEEDADPYTFRRDDGRGIAHAFGELSSYDSPHFGVLDAWGGGDNNRTYNVEVNFREFARLELWDGKRGGTTFWFRVSNFHEWHYALKAKFDAATSKWQNNGSASANGSLAP